jgi:hypothetical protein
MVPVELATPDGIELVLLLVLAVTLRIRELYVSAI